MEAGVAVRLPRGAAAARRQPRRLRHRQPVVHRRPLRRHEIKAYYNACLHRGRQLKDYGGRCSEIRCPFHGFTWALDGALASIPAAWDFEHVDDEEFSLPEAKVGTWGGFVFINPDPDAEPLEDFLGELPEQFERWKLEDRYIQGHVQKVIRANWKIVQEAFCESYHAPTTHPQTAAYLGDVNSQVDIWDNFARVITPGGTPSPLLKWDPTEEEILRYMLDIRDDEESFISLEAGKTAREASAAAARERWRPVVGDMVDEWCDAEFIDNIDYTLFPNMHPWGAYNRIVYRFRPERRQPPRGVDGRVPAGPVRRRAAAAGGDHLPRARRRLDRRPRAGHAGEGVHAGQLQHADGAEGPRDDGQARA